MSKEKAIIEMVIRWLDSNIDEPPPEGVQEDSANLKEKIELALDPKATIEDIEAGNIWKASSKPQATSSKLDND